MIKRLFDFVCALAGLFVLMPVIVVVAILIRRKLGSPVFFRQTRPGLHGKPFEMVKFRTMLDATDKHGNPLPDDQRMTPFGSFLRATSLDELPELPAQGRRHRDRDAGGRASQHHEDAKRQCDRVLIVVKSVQPADQRDDRHDQLDRVEYAALLAGFRICCHVCLNLSVGVRALLHRRAARAVARVAGQEGIEPPTCGFGDRRSAN